MISIYNIKPRFQKLLSPVLVVLHRHGVSANQLTICAILLSFVMGILFWFADQNRVLYLVLPIGLTIRMALNALDGMMARTYHQQTKKGEVLNELGDIVSDLFIFFPLLKHEKEVLYLVVLFICFSIINEFAGLLGKVVNGERRYDGPLGKSDRAFIIGLYGLLSYFAVHLHEFSLYLFILINVLLLLSTGIRIHKSLR
ncbi:MAG: CDP-alcohol phosphatidyltransferase family protein [Chitinophagaceae bacterium]|nr:CDP-alcohol phosphatidyltransferase family protein [Chitinophagaceae bacterium]